MLLEFPLREPADGASAIEYDRPRAGSALVEGQHE
jgi:hypothetical protein